jgi:GT2 family glycosyltransferase
VSEDAQKEAVAGVVVNYNAREHLLSCVGSLLGQGVAPVVVADNGSRDGSEMALLERYPEAKWVPTRPWTAVISSFATPMWSWARVL